MTHKYGLFTTMKSGEKKTCSYLFYNWCQNIYYLHKIHGIKSVTIGKLKCIKMKIFIIIHYLYIYNKKLKIKIMVTIVMYIQYGNELYVCGIYS